MKKRLLCLLLCVVMVAACLAGCSKKDDDEAIEDVNKEASESAMTLSMYLLSEEEVSEEQADKIEAAVNKITKSKFKTQLELNFFTADEYYEKLEESFAARAEAEAAGLISQPTAEDETAEDETFENEWGLAEIKYPTIAGYQVDIFYVGGYDKFAEYMEMNMLSNLNEELSSASKELNSYITPQYLSYTKSLNNGTYAIPTNAAIGEYTYLLLNKEALAQYSYDTDAGINALKSSGITGEAIQTFIREASDASATKKYVPFYSDLTDVELASTGVHYWGVDADGHVSDKFSLLASTYNISAKYGTKDSFMDNMGSVLDTAFVDQLKVVKGYTKGSAEQFANGEVAVACVQGGAEIPSQYADKYEAVVIGKPTLKTDDIYKDMFAVTSYTTSVSRSMEIVTYLNTNADFRNLILYGIEDENYELVNSDYKSADGEYIKVVRRLNEDYMMDANKTGNTLITYSLEGENPTLKDFIKEQNNDVVIDLIMGFRYSHNDLTADAEKLQQLRTVSEKVEKMLNECDAEDLVEIADPAEGAEKDVITQIKEILVGEEGACVYALSDNTAPAEDATVAGLRYLYEEWGISKKIYERPAEEEGIE
ncbi:MAG: hypothetical protein IKJ00_09430 [Clostridia bacterium]|nr:hypothetical protein [Clostridia bacterium]